VIPVAHIARVYGRENDTPLPADPAASIADWSLVGRGAGASVNLLLTAAKREWDSVDLAKEQHIKRCHLASLIALSRRDISCL